MSETAARLHRSPLGCLSGARAGARSSSVRSCLLLLVLACVLPAALGAALLIVQAYRDGHARLTGRAANVSRSVMGSVDEQIRNATAALQVLATSPSLEQPDLAAFHAQALRALPYQSGNNFVLSDLTGQQLVNTLVPYGKPLPMHGNPALQRTAIARGAPVVSDLFVGGLLRRPLMAVEVPVAVQGVTRYTLAMGFLPDRFANVLANQRPEPDWVVAVFDRTGTVVARTHNAEQFVGQKGAPGLMAAMLRDDQGVVDTDTLEGVPVLAAFTRSAVTGWTVAVGVPRQALLARLNQWIALLAATVVAVLAFGVGMATLISRRIAASIDLLIPPAEALGRGETVQPAALPLLEADAVADALSRASALLQARTHERDEATQATMAARMQARHLEHAAHHDALTELPNRAHFQQLLAQRVEACQREGGHLTLFFVDLDDFKPVNDTYGHQMGDKLLRSFAARLLSGVRATDHVARLGGDEFAVLLEELPRREAQPIAAALSERLSRPYAIDHIELHVSACIGVAGCPEDGRDAGSLLEAADAAMYRAKAAGKGRYSVSGFGSL